MGDAQKYSEESVNKLADAMDTIADLLVKAKDISIYACAPAQVMRGGALMVQPGDLIRECEEVRGREDDLEQLLTQPQYGQALAVLEQCRRQVPAAGRLADRVYEWNSELKPKAPTSQE